MKTTVLHAETSVDLTQRIAIYKKEENMDKPYKMIEVNNE